MDATVVCFGEVLLRLGAPGRERLLQSPRLAVHVGGAEANVAVSLARFGHHAAMAGTISDNVLGQAAIGELRRHGVDTRRMRVEPDAWVLYYLATGAGHRPSEVLYDRAHSSFALAPAGCLRLARIAVGRARAASVRHHARARPQHRGCRACRRPRRPRGRGDGFVRWQFPRKALGAVVGRPEGDRCAG